MRNFSETKGRRVVARLAVIGLMSGAVAGCSSDSTRFAGLPDFNFGNTQPQGAAPEVTGSLRPAPTGRVDSAALPPPGPAGMPNSYAASAPAQPYGSANYAAGGNYVAPGYTPPSAPAAPRVAGGTHVVQGGETLASVARLYNVTPAALGAANNIAPGMTVRTGQSLVIPTGAAAATAVRAAVPATPSGGTLGTMPAPSPVVASTHPAPPVTAAAKPTQAPALMASAPVPSTMAPMKTAAAPAPAASAPAKVAAAPVAEPKIETAAKVTAVADAGADDAPRATGGGPQFRAPVRGRVVSSFGPKPGGARNDGVNFAVPEGTSVRAAEDGVVAYAGNELKGYGNLVLIKHADGYVTAYAHASELDVKRGDTVRRGQIIAKAGQSGSVQSPQLHFEIRKGSTAVDPARYVAGL
ncbi:peptidoglycan DD-metalloendopeptidase family protein [Xanthobacter sediminis]|uniref:peptidoglycan DD-metalloendopeptidase family protein n=1 Tax=Xanthobacter sediminis TaxID=3119926 RepID=UPI003726D8DE